MTNEATTPSGQPLGISHKPSKSVAMFTKFEGREQARLHRLPALRLP